MLGKIKLGTYMLGTSDDELTFGFGQAQASILSTTNKHGQAQAQIKQTYSQHAQAEGYITLGFTVQAYAQAQAWIEDTYVAYGQSNALVDSPIKNVYGQAQAYIYVVVIETVLLDTFSRVTGIVTNSPSTMSPPDIGPDYDVFSAFAPGAQINGTRVIQTATADYDAIYFESPISSKDVEASMDFFASEYTNFSYHAIYVRGNPVIPFTELYLWASEGDLNLQTSTTVILATTPFTLTNGVTYRLKIQAIGTTAKGKIWDISGSEPDWMISTTIPDPHNIFGKAKFYGDVGEAGTYPITLALDNFNVTELTLAPIRAGYGQARAKINAFDVPQSGQAQAFIFGQFFKWAQAQAKINAFDVTYSGQAQAHIKIEAIEGVAQAQALVISRRRAMGQAQAMIEITYRPVAQAQAYIYRPQGYGQAQAYLCPGVLISDTFTRTTTGEIDGPEVGPDYEEFSSSISDVGVNGTQLVAAFDDSNEYAWLEFQSRNSVRDTITIVDIKHSTINDWETFLELTQRLGASLGNGITAFIYYDVDLNEMGIDIPTGVSSFLSTTLPKFDDDTFYTAKLSVEGNSPINIKFKIWKTSDSEPGAWLLESAYNPPASTALARDKGGFALYSDIGENLPLTNTITIDNLLVVGCLAPDVSVHGQAQAKIIQPARGYGQARARIRPITGSGQARAIIKRTFRAHGLARARIGINKYGFGQARAFMIGNEKRQHAQAQAHIAIRYVPTGNAQAFIQKAQGNGQAQAKILAFGQRGYGQARTSIFAVAVTQRSAQAQAYIRGPAFGQANALITGGRYLARFNNYQLPGYVQEESINSISSIRSYNPVFEDNKLSEYTGLQNKFINLRVMVIGTNYLEVKNQVQQATTIVRSTKNYAKLYVQYSNKYYEGFNKTISVEKAVRQSMKSAIYAVEFEVKPWLFSDTTHTITGSGLITTDQIGRDIYDGTWSPVSITVTGNNITVSGYTETGEYTGFASIEGAVTNYNIDVTAFDEAVNTDENIYVGPGKTYFDINGATSATITWRDRWNL